MSGRLHIRHPNVECIPPLEQWPAQRQNRMNGYLAHVRYPPSVAKWKAKAIIDGPMDLIMFVGAEPPDRAANDIERAAYSRGLDAGLEAGKKEGHSAGYKDGYAAGFDKGRMKGARIMFAAMLVFYAVAAIIYEVFIA